MSKITEAHHHYQTIALHTARFLEHKQRLSGVPGISANPLAESQKQKIFEAWAGISHTRFLQYLTLTSTTERLTAANVKAKQVSAKKVEVGSQANRLRVIRTTPENRGKHLVIRYCFGSSPFGHTLIASTEEGICKLAFFDHEDEKASLVQELRATWSEATMTQDQTLAAELSDPIFDKPDEENPPLTVVLKGTPFQLAVWETLLRIPEGSLLSYQQVAHAMGKPSAVRAVASAIAGNLVALLVPCHRVIRQTGLINQYRYGAERKAAMLGLEMARQSKR